MFNTPCSSNVLSTGLSAGSSYMPLSEKSKCSSELNTSFSPLPQNTSSSSYIGQVPLTTTISSAGYGGSLTTTTVSSAGYGGSLTTTNVTPSNGSFIVSNAGSGFGKTCVHFNQGIGNGAEGGDPGKSKPRGGSNDETGRTPGKSR